MVRCDANTTYDERTATVTIKMEELFQIVTIKQPANLGIVLATQLYDLASDARTLEITVQANVQYSVAISGNWIKQTGTKGLTTDKLTFSIEENKTYDSREGKITIKSQNSSVQDQVITVRQAQKDALIIKDTSFDMPYGGGEIEVKVEANVEFEVKPDVDWIHYVETKALSNSTIRMTVDENPTYENRSGKIEVKQKNGELSHTITVNQAQRIAVTSVELDKTSLKINVGDSETLVATVKPDNATDKTVTWTSSDEAIATIDETGKVTAVKEGSATITAKAGEKTAECKVTVLVAVTSVELNKTTLSIIEGESETLTATVKPDNATDKTVIWTSSDEKIATVKDGKVTAVKVGEATITATAGDKTTECKVTVTPVPVSSVSLNYTSLELTEGETAKLEATVLPDNAADKTVTWSTSDYGIARVNDKGKVTAMKEGTASITAQAGDKTAVCTVVVKAKAYIPVDNISLNKTELVLLAELSEQLFVTITPYNASDQSVSWSSSDTSIATVDEVGKVTAVKEGSATITVKAGDKTAECKITVNNNIILVAGVSVNPNSLTLQIGESAVLTATVFPDDATDKTVSWVSSAPEVMTVNADGKVTAVKSGGANIFAYAGSTYAVCTVVVPVDPGESEGIGYEQY